MTLFAEKLILNGPTHSLPLSEREVIYMAKKANGKLVKVEESSPTTGMAMFERLAADPSVDVGKLERLIDMQKDILHHTAEAAFNAAFAVMQTEIPEIEEKGRVTDRYTYATNEDIQETLRPILGRHGFSLTFRSEYPTPDAIKVIGILMHRDGFSRSSEFVASADTSGSKNAVQALGSTLSYGHRYTTRDLLNITSRAGGEEVISLTRDDDGVASGAPVEHVEATEFSSPSTPAEKGNGNGGWQTKPVTAKQVGRLYAIMKAQGKNEDATLGYARAEFDVRSFEELNRQDYDEVIKWIEG
jgi:hypothetical protein